MLGKGSRLKPLSRNQIAWRAAQDIKPGSAVNLGIGLPELVANHVPAEHEIVLHSENGILGMGRQALPGEEDPALINAGKKPITMVSGASIFDHAQSFALVRGGHLDICMLGAYQVGANGDLANWLRDDDDPLPAVGGAMDLAAGAKQVFVLMSHTQTNGEPRLLERCSYPLTCAGVVKRLFTDLAVIELGQEGAQVREMIAGLSRDELQGRTGASLAFSPDVAVLATPHGV